MYEAFFEKRGITQNDLENAVHSTVPLSVTQKEQIKRLRDWANVRAVSATARADLSESYADASDNDEPSSPAHGGRMLDY